MSVLRAIEVREQLGARLDIRVDPARVHGWVWSELPLVKWARNTRIAPHLPPAVRGLWLGQIRRTHPFVLTQRRFPTIVPLTEYEISRWVTDLVQVSRDAPREGLWYRDLCHLIDTTGSAGSYRATSYEGVEEFLTGYMLPLIASIEAHGYDPARTHETGWALIGPSGEVLKTKRATHRFFIAKALGVPTFPLQVAAVHADWWRRVVPGAGRVGRAVPGWEDHLEAALEMVTAEHSS